MALTAYCKKCGREVPPADICPRCGTKLGRTAVHAAWCVERRPVADWMCWNAVMRILLPTGLAVLLLVFLLELLSGGTGALERLFLSGFPVTLAILLATVTVVVFLALLLQGKDLMDYVVDSRGIHVTRYLPSPTPLKLLLRFRSPALMETAGNNGEGTPVIRVDEREIAWKDIARVQLWPEKCAVLFYAPSWWLRIPVSCTPFTWEDVMGFIREKLGKKKKVILPAGLRMETEKKTAAGRSTTAQKFPEQDAVEAALPPEPWPETGAESETADPAPSEASEGQISMEEAFAETENQP